MMMTMVIGGGGGSLKATVLMNGFGPLTIGDIGFDSVDWRRAGDPQ
jgi:hypothetical protein